jgi:hypothetical protein
MSTSKKYARTMEFQNDKDSNFTENAETLTEALDRELKYLISSGQWERRIVVSLTIKLQK